MTELEIARSLKSHSIQSIAQKLGIAPDELIPYGRFKAKVSPVVLARQETKRIGRYILVSAINPTPLGEGKTTTSIRLAMGLARVGLPKKPAGERIDLDPSTGQIVGLP